MPSKKLAPKPAASRARRDRVLPRPRIGLAVAALAFIAAAVGLFVATRDPYDGAAVVRASISNGPTLAAPSAPRPALAPLAGLALPQAPLAGLAAPGPAGPLPIIAVDGRTPWRAYARPFADNGRPKVALVIGGLGLNDKATLAAIDTLPAQITLSFSPYADGLQGWIDRARAAGHEVLLEIPMEPMEYPDNDPGPYTLMAADPPAETVRRLQWLMSRGAGYFGVINQLGGRFLASQKGLDAVSQVLRQRGVALLDDGQAAGRGGGLPRASAARSIDSDLEADAIDRQLLTLEAQALQNGGALGLGQAYPLTVAQVRRWAGEVGQRGYALAPASALAAIR
jgi:polysaccharide deacetylase 2 family uncharacterized protein YibQ